MIFGPDTAVLRAALVIFVLSMATAHAERDIDAPNWGIAQLMDEMRQLRSGSARFVERRTLQLMTAPLISSGTLRYVAPDRLDKETLHPTPGRLSIAGDRLVVDRPGEPTRTVSLQDYPEIAALVAGVRATMAGDAATLNRFFTLALEGTQAAWRLSLEPRDAKLRGIVARIEISGRQNQLTRVDTHEADGDRSEMIIDAAPP